MKKFSFIYYGEPHFKTKDEGVEYMSEWRSWMKKLGTSIIDPGVPFGKTKNVSSKGIKEGKSKNRLTGYSMVKAANMQAAVTMAKKCPHLKYGTIDVAEVMDMAME